MNNDCNPTTTTTTPPPQTTTTTRPPECLTTPPPEDFLLRDAQNRREAVKDRRIENLEKKIGQSELEIESLLEQKIAANNQIKTKRGPLTAWELD